MDLRCIFLVKNVIEINHFGCFMIRLIKYILNTDFVKSAHRHVHFFLDNKIYYNKN
jgi:hypothetical protein